MSPSAEALSVVLAPVVESLRNGLGDNLLALVLFGSRARGDALPDSDWDLLLIAENLPDSPWHRQQQILALLPQSWRHQVNVLAHTFSEWFARVTPLALDIALDGIVLYDHTQDLLPARLSALRKQVSDLGLERQAIGEHEWVWLWRDKPQRRWRLEWRHNYAGDDA
ncbi:MAG: nucleotidyltransferase domain-containing protein [Roseiflexus sp.]|uniref:nucleotidyltransferase domain-containing protein n=1 Tax=Roseiflexus sp. TaxID=2562120 RepID=UPI0025DEBC38|nr:nucleotidyltransferase domain-containing protein [Roseiflexus sp.]MCL6543062.1 nucleotidyltransferase domain-containing protein [Roseiflexus sp.]